jgi:protein-S-isoprenylcysteine O-methyltransferase Ste14
MLPYSHLVIVAAFTVIGIGLLSVILRHRTNGMSFLGTPTINRYLFYSGKISLFASWGIFLFTAIVPSRGIFTVPPLPEWIAAFLIVAAMLLFIRSFRDLGTALKVGLPEEETNLKTNGIYGFSRNPIYLAVFLICIASCLFFPHPVNIACSLYGIVIHFLITLSEEKFLAKRFGAEWEEYRRRVRRYF